jgi:GMP synthase (glutamine-hydrolysing)
MDTLYDTILILDFGSQYTHLIARRIRECGVYCELMACNTPISSLAFVPKGIILSGGPYSVYSADAPHIDPKIWDLKVPVLGICYGLQEIAWNRGGQVIASDKKEYGKAEISKIKDSPLFQGLDGDMTVWMSHGDQLSVLPPGFEAVAVTSTAPLAAIHNITEKIFGIQFHPEVTHTPQGKRMLENFVVNICKVEANWTMVGYDLLIIRILLLIKK